MSMTTTGAVVFLATLLVGLSGFLPPAGGANTADHGGDPSPSDTIVGVNDVGQQQHDSIHSSTNPAFKRRWMHRGYDHAVFSSLHSSGVETDGNDDDDNERYPDVEEGYLAQRLDHFSVVAAAVPNSAKNDDANTPVENTRKTYQQRYFYSKRYVMASNPTDDDDNNYDENDEAAPVYAFLCVGGEGPALDKSVLVNSVHCTGDMLELAKKLYENGDASIHVFALEHRYYGKSVPHKITPPGETKKVESMQFLSSRQALADIAHFVTEMNTRHDLSPGVRWVTFGGSYPGMLSGWARYRFPHLIHASVSNSAPMQAKLDFFEYNTVVSRALKDVQVGGSERCYELVRRGHDELALMIWSDGDDDDDDEGLKANREYVADLFQVCGGADTLKIRRNVENLVGDGVISVPAQGNDPSCTEDLCNIEKLCDALLEGDESDPFDAPVERLAAIWRRQEHPVPTVEQSTSRGIISPASTAEVNDGVDPPIVINCTDVSWEHYISIIPRTESWLWQTCTEFGFYQTCEHPSSSSSSSDCPYARGFHSLDKDLEMCRRVMGIDPDAVRENVANTQEWYGGWNMEGSRILFVNGDVDPWSALAITPKNHKREGGNPDDLPSILVEGASHHFWTHPVKESDGEHIVKAREIIHDTVTRWLQEDAAEDIVSMTE